jgi:hypothetical protein
MKLDIKLPNSSLSTENVENSADSAITCSNLQPLCEKLIFLCGQCNDGFGSLEACKQHMMQVINSDMKWQFYSVVFYSYGVYFHEKRQAVFFNDVKKLVVL